jgi:Domain of unknown function (DUF222)
MTALQHSDLHPVPALGHWLHDELASLAGAPLWSMTAAETADALLLLTQARSQLDELLMRVLRHAESVGVGSDLGATTVNWWAHSSRLPRAEAHRTARLAEAMERHHAVAAALAAGHVHTDQAQVIVDAVDDLPDDIESWVAPAATAFLMDRAAEHDAKALRVLGRRVLEVIDPATADAEEARRLAAEEADARATAFLTLVDDGHGRAHGRFSIPTLHGEMLRRHLLATVFGSPTTVGEASSAEKPGTDSRSSRPAAEKLLTRHRMGLAFLDYLETRPEGSLPSAGGVPATVVVTMQLETLLGGLGAASLDTGPRISASEARRLACRAGIIPMVLAGPSVVLDAGRKRRFHSETQRIAMGIRDNGCTAAGCDAPPSLTQAHHDQVAWSRGGGTSVEKGRLLCPRHHRLVHDPAYQHTLDKHGKVRFSRRT